ncbi:hypothetical protein [Ferruginibacter sp.]
MKQRLIFLQELLNYSEMVALVAGLIAWIFITDKRVRYFVVYLAFIVACEQLGHYFAKSQLKTENVILYNYLVIPVEFLFNIWFLYSFMPSKKRWQLCFVFSITGILAQVIELTFLKDERFFFSSLSYIVNTFLLLVVILMFLLQFIKTDQLLQYYRHFSFWAAIALLIYYLGSFPLFAFYNYLYQSDKSSFYVYWQIQICLNILMYLLFAAGLLWTNIKYRSSSP